MQKTFREVIRDIKEGEVWENDTKIIKCVQDGISIKSKIRTTNNIMGFCDIKKYKIQRKQYTFEEAFKAYEEGKEIESCVNNESYFKEKDEHSSYKNFTFNQIRGTWYINN